jgi:hypothetical protein
LKSMGIKYWHALFIIKAFTFFNTNASSSNQTVLRFADLLQCATFGGKYTAT